MEGVVHNQVAAIMEFFHTEAIKPQDTELEMIDVIAAHLGLVIEQRRRKKVARLI